MMNRQTPVRAIALGALLTIGFAPATQAQTSETGGRQQVRSACQADIRKLCAGIRPGGGRIQNCFREKQDQVSTGCKAALAAMRQK